MQLLSDLPRDADGLVSFHDAQKRIVGYREKQIARFKVIFPDLVSGETKKLREARPSENSLAATKGNANGGLMCPTEEAGVYIGGGLQTASGVATELVAGAMGMVGLKEGTSAGHPVEEKRRGKGGVLLLGNRRPKFNADVAPPEMFIKDAGFTPAGMAKHVSLLYF